MTSFTSVYVAPLVDDTIEIEINMADITWDSSGTTYLANPHDLDPSRPTPRPMSLAPAEILAKIRQNMQDVAQGNGTHVMEFNLSRRLPREEQYRILLLRELPES